jgi:pyrophosphate--fructose-6-phosphate 1-phosphotransferase
LEERKGKMELVIAKALVDLESPAYRGFQIEREKWILKDNYRIPGPIQFQGENADSRPIIMQLNEFGKDSV